MKDWEGVGKADCMGDWRGDKIGLVIVADGVANGDSIDAPKRVGEGAREGAAVDGCDTGWGRRRGVALKSVIWILSGVGF